MFRWLKRKSADSQEHWLRAQQAPGTVFPFPKGTRLKPEEEVILALPRALITDNEKIGSVLLCDDDADFALNEKAGAYYVRLKPGMTFSLSKSCEITIVADDKRPRFFRIMKPDQKLTEPGAASNGGLPPSVS